MVAFNLSHLFIFDLQHLSSSVDQWSNGCILCKKEFKAIPKCSKYGVSYYKIKDDNGSSEETIKEGLHIKVL